MTEPWLEFGSPTFGMESGEVRIFFLFTSRSCCRGQRTSSIQLFNGLSLRVTTCQPPGFVNTGYLPSSSPAATHIWTFFSVYSQELKLRLVLPMDSTVQKLEGLWEWAGSSWSLGLAGLLHAGALWPQNAKRKQTVCSEPQVFSQLAGHRSILCGMSLEGGLRSKD